MDQRIGIEPSSNRNVRAYHVQEELTEEAALDGSKGHPGNLNPLGNLLLSVKGVESVQVRPYTVLVAKAEMFDWAPIELEVLEVLQYGIRAIREGSDIGSLPERS